MAHPSTPAKVLLIALAFCAGSTAAVGASSIGGFEPTVSFDQVDLAVTPIQGAIVLNASAGWVWRDGSTNRIVLDRDVEVTIGGSKIQARRADLWLRPTGNGAYQIFGVFEDMTTRSTNAQAQTAGKLVPVRAIVQLDQSIKLRLGARMDQSPDRSDLAEFMARSAVVFNQRLLGQEPERVETPLRWAPKPYEPDQEQRVAEVSRSLPLPSPTRKKSRVERMLAQSYRGDPERLRRALPVLPEERVATVKPATTKPASAQSPVQPSEQPSEQKAEHKPPLPPIFKASGIFSLSIEGKVVLQGAQSGVEGQPARPATITAEGGITMQYQDPASRQTMDMEAQRAVIFLKDDASPAAAAPTQLNASQIQGLYLEGGVFAGNADWSVRSPKIYIDLEQDKMLMLDAVFWTVDQKTNMPLYLRAESVRQTSLGEFEAKKARIANSAFFEPDLSIGVSKLKISVRQEESQPTGLLGLVGSVRDRFGASGQPDGQSQIEDSQIEDSIDPGSDLVRRVYVDGKNITLRLGSIPILWFPVIKGDTDAFPLKEIRIGDTNRTGLSIRTRWDAFSLLGIDPIEGVKTSLQLDYYGERGFAFGLDANWNKNNHRGNLYSYLLPADNGTDIMASGRKIERTGEIRGIIKADNIWTLDDAWSIIAKGAYISDEGFIPAFEEQMGREIPDFDSLLRIERTGENSQLSLEVSGSPNDFFASEQLLQSPGYAVDKLPELKFVSFSRDLFADTMPGVFEYQYEASIGAMRLRFSEVTAAEYGFDTPNLSTSAFGTLPGVSLGDAQRALGLDEDMVSRFDTRQEINARFDFGPVRAMPVVVGRVTAYDTSFDTFSPNQADEIRFWGGGGLVLSTTLTKVDDEAISNFFDIHRIRHIVEPSVSIWHADSAFAASDTPIFDDDVEGLLVGTMFRVAVDQTWTTKRGGPGRWRDADILTLNTEYVWSSDRAGTSVIPDYFLARPELSNPGEYFGSEIVFSPTDILAFSSSMVFDLNMNQAARSSFGAIVQHHPGFISSLEYRDIRAIDASYLSARTQYTLTDKYTFSTSANYNFDRGDFQNFFIRLERQFQIGAVGFSLNYNNIRNETTFGIILRPFGTSGTSAGAGGDFLRD